MLDTFRNLFRRLSATPPARHFGEDDNRLALAALLVNCMGIDGAASEAEQRKLEDLLGRTFGLTGGDLQTLIADGRAAEGEATDLYRFTSVIKRHMSEDQRVGVVENLWEIVLADGVSHEFEDNLVWRVAELLGVNRQDRIAARRAAGEKKPSMVAGETR